MYIYYVKAKSTPGSVAEVIIMSYHTYIVNEHEREREREGEKE